MNIYKKIIILICLSSMMLGFSLSSKNEISKKIKLDKVDEEIKAENISESVVKYEKDIKKLMDYNKEEVRISNVNYIRKNITIPSGINNDEMKSVLLNTVGAKTMVHLADAFVEAENKYGVNAFFMAGVVALESGFATSRRAVEDNNLTGYEVYSDDSEGKLFKSQMESILQTAKHLNENYLTEGGVYYNGLSVDAVQIKYCPDEGKGKNWEGKVNELANSFLNTYNNLYKVDVQIADNK